MGKEKQTLDVSAKVKENCMNLNTFCEGEPHNSKSSIPDIQVICPLCMMYQLIVVSMYCQSSCVSTLWFYFVVLLSFSILFFFTLFFY